MKTILISFQYLLKKERTMKIEKVTQNTIANLASRLWSMVVTFLFVPLYLRYLGEEAYGIVSFYATLQATLNLLGLGLSSTLRREFSTGDDSQDSRRQKYLLLRSVENIYFVIATIIILICFLGARFIAESWLNLTDITVNYAAHVIFLMGITIALQLVSNLYFGCLLGLGRQVTANKYYLVWNLVKNIGAVSIIILISPNLVYFYLWYTVCDLVYLLCTRIKSVQLLFLENENKKWNFKDFGNLRSIWMYAMGLLVISCISVLSRQMDKGIISKMLTVTELGAYNSAVTLGQLTAIIPGAVSIAIMTEFTRLFSDGETEKLNQQYHNYLSKITLVTIAMGSYISVYAKELLLVWTQSENIVAIIGNTVPYLVIGTTFLSIQEIPYSFLLAHGETHINVIMGICTIPIMAAGSWWFISTKGIQGAGIVYCAVMIIQTAIYLLIVEMKYLKSAGIRYLAVNLVLLPAVCLAIACASRQFCNARITNLYLKCLFAVVSGGGTLLMLYAVLRKENKWKK